MGYNLIDELSPQIDKNGEKLFFCQFFLSESRIFIEKQGQITLLECRFVGVKELADQLWGY
jgi:hypothetical protein